MTGLALGGDGTIYSGGSHWLQGQGSTWRVDGIVGAYASVSTLLSGQAEGQTCVASPLVDTAGELA